MKELNDERMMKEVAMMLCRDLFEGYDDLTERQQAILLNRMRINLQELDKEE